MTTRGTANPIETDAVVIGAGPIGLFQVFELGLQELRAHVIDALPQIGGQCIELYPHKPIYDIPAVPVCTAKELVERLQTQIRPFATPFHLGQTVTALARQADGRFALETSAGLRFLAPVVVIAAGAGAFEPRKLKLDGIEHHAGAQLLYHAPPVERLAGQRIVVVGGGGAAVEAALRWAEPGRHRAASVTLVHRRDVFDAEPASLARLGELREAGALRFVAGQVIGWHPDGRGLIGSIQILGSEDNPIDLPLDTLLVAYGLSPRLGPIADWGLALERKQLVVDTAKFETSVPGIFAVGDIVTYPGKRKLIVSGFHEATLAAFAAAAHLRPQQPQPLLYTTTSSKLHRVLGVALPGSD